MFTHNNKWMSDELQAAALEAVKLDEQEKHVRPPLFWRMTRALHQYGDAIFIVAVIITLVLLVIVL